MKWQVNAARIASAFRQLPNARAGTPAAARQPHRRSLIIQDVLQFLRTPVQLGCFVRNASCPLQLVLQARRLPLHGAQEQVNLLGWVAALQVAAP